MRHVHAALAEVTVQSTRRSRSGPAAPAKLAQVVAERSGGTAASSQPGQCRRAGHVRGRAEARTRAPSRCAPPRRRRRTAGSRGAPARARAASTRSRALRVGFLPRVAAELDEQPAVAVGQHRGSSFGCSPCSRMSSTSTLVDRLAAPIGPVPITSGTWSRGRRRRRGSRGRTACAPRGQATSRTVASEDRHARPFGADQRPRHVEAVLGQQLVEVVAGDAPRDSRDSARG